MNQQRDEYLAKAQEAELQAAQAHNAYTDTQPSFGDP